MKRTPVGEQQLKWTQSGGSLVWPRKTSGCHTRYCILRLLVHQGSYTGLNRRGQEGKTSEAYLAMSAEKRELSCAHCANGVRARQTSELQGEPE